MTEGDGHAKPKYRQIADDLRAAIASGTYAPGSQLPTKDALKAQYGAALGTIDRAIEVLRREGLAETAHGAGTFVTEPPVRHDPEHDALSARLDAAEARIDELAERVRGLEPPDGKPEPQPVAAAIVTSGSAVLVTRRRDGRPEYSWVTGEIEPGESPAQAAEREVKEETGLRVIAGQEIGRRVHPLSGRLMIYMAAAPAERDTTVHVGDEEELAAVWWADLDEAERLMGGLMHEPVREYLRRVLRQ
jgi:DNA-binding transcriptional regulator YhcF (GntR family)/8-oxo-dGTP pyrophosphatase MutT (NUDIX family)